MQQETPDELRRHRIADIKLDRRIMGMAERRAEEIFIMSEKSRVRQPVQERYQVFIEGAVRG